MEPAWVNELRAQVPVTRECIYLDSAYDCGGTAFGAAAAQRYFDLWHQASSRAERGGPGRATFFRMADETRELICRLVGAGDPNQVCFTKNTNEGINHLLMGFTDFRPGDNVVTNDLEHQSVIMPCLNLEKVRGVECRVVKSVEGQLPTQSFIDACDEHTRMIVVGHVQSCNAFKVDLPALGAFCREKGIYLIVDAIQSLGWSVFEAEKWGVSAVAAAGYKALMADVACGFIWVDPELMRHVWPLYLSECPGIKVDRSNPDKWTFTEEHPEWAKKMENGSLDVPGIFMLNAGIKRVLEIGLGEIEAHIRSLYDHLYDGLVALGISPITPKDPRHSCAAIALELPDKAGFTARLLEQGVVISNSRHVRISLAAYNTHEEIDRALEAAAIALQ